jgi:hypothetical protein
MASFRKIVAALRREERRVEKQLASIKNAISSLEFGSGGGVPAFGRRRRFGRSATATAASEGPRKHRRFTMSAAQRRAVSVRMKKYWSQRRAQKKT